MFDETVTLNESILTKMFREGYDDNRIFGWVKKDDKEHYLTSDSISTPGYYNLRKTMLKKKNKLNIYLMVNDGNAPIPLDEVSENATTEEKANSMFLANDQEMFNGMKDINLPNDINDLLNGIWHTSKAQYNWEDLIRSNSKYRQIMSIGIDNTDWKKWANDNANCVNEIFGLFNPYKSTNIVYGRRLNYN